MPRLGNIGKVVRAASESAEKVRYASKEKLPSVDAGQLSSRIRDASEKARESTETAAEKAFDASREKLRGIDTNEISHRARDTSERAKAAMRSSTLVSQEVVDEAFAQVTEFKERAQGLPNEVIDKLFPECSAPMYIMPTGPGQEDYALVFQFDEIIKNLDRGVFVRPKIEAWSPGFRAYDLERLGEELKGEFTSQFAQARETQVQSIEDMESAAEKISTGTTTGLKVSGVEIISLSLTAAGLAASLPLVISGIGGGLLAVILLLFALGYGARAMSLIESLVNQMSRSGSAKGELSRGIRDESEALSELDSKSRTFRRAVQNIEMKTHPQLRELYSLICDVESSPQPSADCEPATDAPDIQPYLSHPEFLRKLPDHYEGLLGVISNSP